SPCRRWPSRSVPCARADWGPASPRSSRSSHQGTHPMCVEDHTERSMKIMATTRIIAVLGFTMALASAAWAQSMMQAIEKEMESAVKQPTDKPAAAPLRLNVKVQVSNLMHEIVAISVRCEVTEGDMKLLIGRSAEQTLASGAFTGTIPV